MQNFRQEKKLLFPINVAIQISCEKNELIDCYRKVKKRDRPKQISLSKSSQLHLYTANIYELITYG